MKKTGKFRAWLIHKLGGITQEEKTQFQILEIPGETIRLEAKVRVPIRFPLEADACIVKEELVKQLSIESMKYINIQRKFDFISDSCIYSGTLTVVNNK